jgi:hypothetical protein
MNFLLESIGQYYGSDWVGMILMCLSIYYLGNQQRVGFVIGIGSCMGWFVFGILTGSIPDIVTQFIVTAMHIRGFVQWRTTTLISTNAV